MQQHWVLSGLSRVLIMESGSSSSELKNASFQVPHSTLFPPTNPAWGLGNLGWGFYAGKNVSSGQLLSTKVPHSLLPSLYYSGFREMRMGRGKMGEKRGSTTQSSKPQLLLVS